jgi:hypothetical protein
MKLPPPSHINGNKTEMYPPIFSVTPTLTETKNEYEHQCDKYNLDLLQ